MCTKGKFIFTGQNVRNYNINKAFSYLFVLVPRGPNQKGDPVVLHKYI